MEQNNPEIDMSDKCTVNGDCSPPENKRPSDFNHAKNIDDIATPSDLKFDEEFDFSDPEILEKRKEIEKCLENCDEIKLEEWQSLARRKGGLISDEYRRKIWPLLVGVTKEEMTEPPSLEELSTHPEYNQVVLDVNRSLKRFPPGIPLARRLALQDQLTVLILRVILAYPHLNYYQGYHDVAITLLLVCGARAAFPLLARLSGGERAPLRPFMERTMRAAQHRLNYLQPALQRLNRPLADKLLRAGVGTMFALPWFLTWFGHSLPRYADVVRLYDYFLSAPPLFPVYVTAALVASREDDVLACDDDMASLHCLLSRVSTTAVSLSPVYVTAALVASREDDVLACDDDMASLHCLLAGEHYCCLSLPRVRDGRARGEPRGRRARV
ncbi:rab-GTPase-TBC domain-containing protein [Phthorimaea operculella]|nr:rab-GTPase-TBC domain-containing protein [Phthorimaea operculella]